MRLNIFSKLFLSMLVAMLIMVTVMVFFINMSFRSGFADYLHRGEIDKVKELSILLSQEYEKQGDWEFVRNSPREWSQLMGRINGFPKPRFRPPPRRPKPKRRQGFDQERDFTREGRPPPRFDPRGRPPPRDFRESSRKGNPSPPKFKEGRPTPRFDPRGRPPPSPRLDGDQQPPKRIRPLGDRVSLVDENKDLVVGRRLEPTPSSFNTDIEIKSNGEVRGWIVVRQGTSIIDNLAEKFLEQQFRNFYLIAALAILIAILSSLLLARNFVRPVKAISAGAKTLTEGDLNSQINVVRNDELGDLATHFNTLAITLEKNETQRKQWLVDISHELRTPIAILRSEIEAMLDGIRKPNPVRIESLHTDILSLGKLVDDLYQLSLTDAKEINLDLVPVNLAEVITSATESVKALLKTKRITVELVDIDRLISIDGDVKRLHQLLSNLLANSFRYTDENGQIQILLKIQKENVELIIQDTAPGVPSESLDLLFDRLYRVDKSRNRALGGSGLGLSICSKIVKAHNGNIQAEHSPLGGLLIRIQFPCLNKVK